MAVFKGEDEMKTKRWIYIGEKELQAVAYPVGRNSRRMVRHFCVPLKEGCLRHGRIEKERLFVRSLKMLLAECPFRIRTAELVLPSGLVFVKRMEVPRKANRRQILYGAKMEFPASTPEKNLVFAYRTLKNIPIDDGSTTRMVMAGSLEAELVEQYVRVFRQAGCRVNRISVPEDRALHGAMALMDACEGTTLICAAEEKTVLFGVFADGQFYLHTRFAMERERGSEEAARELWERIREMGRFCEQEPELSALSKVVCFGLHEAEEGLLRRTEMGVELHMGETDLEESLLDAMKQAPMALLSGMDAAGKSMDFLRFGKNRQARTIEKKMPEIPGMWGVITIGTALFLLSGSLALWNQRLEKELYHLQAENESEERRSLYQRELEKEERIQTLSAGVEELLVLSSTENLLEPDGNLLEEIESISGARTRFDYQYSEGDRLLSFSCIAEEYREIPDYVDKVKELSAFDEVFYNGYETVGEAGGYRFHVSCRIAEERSGQ